jgi:mannose-6-phosphate isomerase-like protein (cupin superfamily)
MAQTIGRPVVVQRERPELTSSKRVLSLARTDIIRANLHLVREGGETNLHAHPKSDGLWVVLQGRARFYGEGDAVIADIGQHEAVLIPRGFKYWFESASDEPLEILQVAASEVPMPDPAESRADRIDYTPPKASLVEPE